jgi:hypothetical protein
VAKSGRDGCNQSPLPSTHHLSALFRVRSRQSPEALSGHAVEAGARHRVSGCSRSDRQSCADPGSDRRGLLGGCEEDIGVCKGARSSLCIIIAGNLDLTSEQGVQNNKKATGDLAEDAALWVRDIVATVNEVRHEVPRLHALESDVCSLLALVFLASMDPTSDECGQRPREDRIIPVRAKGQIPAQGRIEQSRGCRETRRSQERAQKCS